MRFLGVGLVLILAVSCVGARYRSEGEVSPGALDPVSYRVVLHGGTNANDLETVAFLDPENDGWEVVPVSPPFNYKVVTGVNAVPAVQQARDFVSFHPDLQGVQLRTVRDENGVIFCYEVRPLYRPDRFGKSDILDISYAPKVSGGIMNVYIRIDPGVEREMEPVRDRSGDR